MMDVALSVSVIRCGGNSGECGVVELGGGVCVAVSTGF